MISLSNKKKEKGDGFVCVFLCVPGVRACVWQFQVKMEDCLLRGDSSHLVSLLHYEGLTSTTLTRLDQLVTKVTGWAVSITTGVGRFYRL